MEMSWLSLGGLFDQRPSGRLEGTLWGQPPGRLQRCPHRRVPTVRPTALRPAAAALTESLCQSWRAVPCVQGSRWSGHSQRRHVPLPLGGCWPCALPSSPARASAPSGNCFLVFLNSLAPCPAPALPWRGRWPPTCPAQDPAAAVPLPSCPRWAIPQWFLPALELCSRAVSAAPTRTRQLSWQPVCHRFHCPRLRCHLVYVPHTPMRAHTCAHAC